MSTEAIPSTIGTPDLANALDTLEMEVSWHIPTVMMDRSEVARSLSLLRRGSSWARR